MIFPPLTPNRNLIMSTNIWVNMTLIDLTIVQQMSGRVIFLMRVKVIKMVQLSFVENLHNTFEVGFDFKFTRNDWKRVTVVWSKKLSEGCQWHVHDVVQEPSGCFIIKKLNNIHTCIERIRQKGNKRFDPSVLSSFLTAKVRSNPSIKVNDVMREMKESYGLDVKYHATLCGKDIADNEVNSDEALSFGFLFWYLDEFVHANDGSFLH
ncbi:hypothetical protein C1H46_025698 [Malus baccata]|uniref:Transposase MuDR plant domain-containing protein n=1 Tax=Malus baccata TaxID=106549 RepID=A0A540LQR2_MALBA|nr:hypothetical protein C1H46_025698 [Malus baccata]